ncbi:hypothetical protein C4D60_Mb02t20670 [Musa balbisiana]|uniref:CHCH domain-containing protein n=1 Tax=Musa balbisiana TaxID=52838 RepID=A0A4S8IC60_MUSBA|nr:hypothetical protein C4D60_Mb02t20670 [Musa balbisiana]
MVRSLTNRTGFDQTNSYQLDRDARKRCSSYEVLSFIGRNISEALRSLFCRPFLAAPVDFSHHQKRNRRTTRERTMEAATPQPVCAMEALDLLNCAVDIPFDRDRCLRFLDALRSCVLEKKVKKFSVAEQGHAAEAPKREENL